MKPIRVKAFVFSTTDEDNPDFYAKIEIDKWLDTELGQWLLKHSNPKLECKSEFLVESYSTRYVAFAYLTPELYTFWKLKYE